MGQASNPPSLNESPRANSRLVAGNHPTPLGFSPVGMSVRAQLGSVCRLPAAEEPPATYQGAQTMNPSAPHSETSAQHVLTMPGWQAQHLHPFPSPKPSPGGAQHPSSLLARGSSHTSKGQEFTGEKQGSAGRSELQRLTSLCSASLCNSLQFLASLQFLQPFFTSPSRGGLWTARQQQSHGGSARRGTGLRGGTDSSSPLPAGKGCPSHPSAASSHTFGRDTANSHCDFHSGGCALQAKEVLSL